MRSIPSCLPLIEGSYTLLGGKTEWQVLIAAPCLSSCMFGCGSKPWSGGRIAVDALGLNVFVDLRAGGGEENHEGAGTKRTKV